MYREEGLYVNNEKQNYEENAELIKEEDYEVIEAMIGQLRIEKNSNAWLCAGFALTTIGYGWYFVNNPSILTGILTAGSAILTKSFGHEARLRKKSIESIENGEMYFNFGFDEKK